MPKVDTHDTPRGCMEKKVIQVAIANTQNVHNHGKACQRTSMAVREAVAFLKTKIIMPSEQGQDTDVLHFAMLRVWQYDPEKCKKGKRGEPER